MKSPSWKQDPKGKQREYYELNRDRLREAARLRYYQKKIEAAKG